MSMTKAEKEAKIADLEDQIKELRAMPTELSMKEMLEKLGDPRSEVVSDDPVSKADKSKAVPSLSTFEKQKADREALDKSLDRAGVPRDEDDTEASPVDEAATDAAREMSKADKKARRAERKARKAKRAQEQEAEDAEAEMEAAKEKAKDALPSRDQAAKDRMLAGLKEESFNLEPDVAINPEMAEEMSGDPGDLEMQLFKTAHGGNFDPKSSMDRNKMEKLKKLLLSGQSFGDLTKEENQERFALKLYRQ